MKMIDAGNGDTLWAVVIGAFLATLGGFLATQFESWLRRRERRRGAAMLLSDILYSISELTTRANRIRNVGDPYGPVTMRMMRAARREVDLYDRNREILYDLHDPDLRGRLHTVMITLGMPLDSLFDIHEEILAQEARAKTLNVGTVARRHADQRIKQLQTSRDIAFDFVVETSADGQALIPELTHHGGGGASRPPSAAANAPGAPSPAPAPGAASEPAP